VAAQHHGHLLLLLTLTPFFAFGTRGALWDSDCRPLNLCLVLGYEDLALAWPGGPLVECVGLLWLDYFGSFGTLDPAGMMGLTAGVSGRGSACVFLCRSAIFDSLPVRDLQGRSLVRATEWVKPVPCSHSWAPPQQVDRAPSLMSYLAYPAIRTPLLAAHRAVLVSPSWPVGGKSLAVMGGDLVTGPAPRTRAEGTFPA
jgi:hypothetical protein